MDRQSVLERMGWIFTRIRSSEFLRNPDLAMKPVFEKMKRLEILPAAASPETESAMEASTDVIERVIRRAEVLRKNWSKGGQASDRSSARPAEAATV
jgi:hypothetical protein